ncbi:MAG: SpoIIE family protein phosphatase [Chlorobi bacterium]|nr:SpoIIE family protein phosphatase [Chlorobiota bacterium]
MAYFSILPPAWISYVPQKEDVSLILALAFAVIYALVRGYIVEREIFNFSMVWVLTALFITASGLFEQLIKLAFADVEVVQVRAVSYFLRLVVIAMGISAAMSFIRKLILFKGSKKDHLLWATLEFLIIATYLLNLFYYDPTASIGILIIISFGLLYFLFQLRWLLFIARKELFQSLISIVFIIVALYFILESLRSPELLTYLLVPFYRNSTWVIITGFIGAYALISFLGMIIIFPLRGVIEEFREAEQFMEQLIMENKPLEDWITELAYRARERTSSDGIVVKIPEKGITIKDGVLPSETRLMILCDASMDSCSYMIDNDVKNESNIHSQCIIPIVLEGKCRGVLCAFKSVRHGFDVYLVRLLEEMAYQISLVLLYEESIERRQAITRAQIMLEAARTVQLNLLPALSFESKFMEISVFFKPAQEVGGDIYWWRQYGQSVAFMLADVSGKGIQAAFIMAYLRGVLDAMPPSNWTPTQVPLYIERATKSILLTQEKFITMVWVHADRQKLEVVRCGHPPPIWITESQVKILSEKGLPPISFIEMVAPAEAGITLSEPGFLVLYSDGLSELKIQTEKGEGFLGEEGIAKLLSTAGIRSTDSAEEVLNKFLDKLKEYYGSDMIEFDDDVVIAVIRYMKGQT